MRQRLQQAGVPEEGVTVLFQGSLLYRDSRLNGFDAAALVEVIEHLDACEEFGWRRRNRPPGRSAAPVYLTVSPQSTVLKIEYDEGNTVAKDWFETDAGTLQLTSSGHMIGGVRHRTGYYFEVFFTYDSASKQYVGTGNWIIQDQCEGQAPGYPVTITLKLR